MVTAEAFTVIIRIAKASPCRSAGVIWCSMLSTMGCTQPRVMPISAEPTHITSVDGAKGYAMMRTPANATASVISSHSAR
ncbi:hypothetical protein D3C87_1891970 [compost metagenome]